MPLACFQCVDALYNIRHCFFGGAVLSPSVCFQCLETMVVGDRNMPKACPYVMMRPVVADINHRICQRITHTELFLFLPPSIYPLTRVPFFNWCEWIFNGLNWCFFCYGWRLHGWHIGCLPSKHADGMPLRCRESLFALCSPLVGVWGAFGWLGIFL